MADRTGEQEPLAEPVFNGAKEVEREALYACLARWVGGWSPLLNLAYGPYDQHWNLPRHLGGPERFRRPEDQYEPMTPAEVEVMRAAREKARADHFGSTEVQP